MRSIIGALLCWVGLHVRGSLGWFREILCGKLYLINWERCGRCERVKISATSEEQRPAERREGGE